MSKLVLCLWVSFMLVIAPKVYANAYDVENVADSGKGHDFPKEIKMLRFGVAQENWMPFIGLDNQSGMIGISSDLVKGFKERFNLRIQVVQYPTFDGLLAALASGEIDFTSDVMETTKRQLRFLFSRHYIESHQGIFSHADEKGYPSIKSLAGKHVAIDNNFVSSKEQRNHYPHIKLLSVNSTEQALRLLTEKKVDAYIGNIEVANYLSGQEFISNLRVDAVFPDASSVLSFAIRPGFSALLKPLDDYLSEVGESGLIDDLVVKWSTYNFNPIERYHLRMSRTHTIMFILLLSIVCVVFGRRTVKLK